jgi:hypothetical protein
LFGVSQYSFTFLATVGTWMKRLYKEIEETYRKVWKSVVR